MRAGTIVRFLSLPLGAVSHLGPDRLCTSGTERRNCRRRPMSPRREQPGEEYVIGPLDQLNIFVWRNPELSAKVQVRPDGRITTPLVNDMPAVRQDARRCCPPT